jgi:hypothetical protein
MEETFPNKEIKKKTNKRRDEFGFLNSRQQVKTLNKP